MAKILREEKKVMNVDKTSEANENGEVFLTTEIRKALNTIIGEKYSNGRNLENLHFLADMPNKDAELYITKALADYTNLTERKIIPDDAIGNGEEAHGIISRLLSVKKYRQERNEKAKMMKKK